jgi:hypothetical protein
MRYQKAERTYIIKGVCAPRSLKYDQNLVPFFTRESAFRGMIVPVLVAENRALDLLTRHFIFFVLEECK